MPSGGLAIPDEPRVSGIVLAGVLDYFAKVWGKIAEADLRKKMGLGEIYVGSWYPLENLEMILRKIWQETPTRMELAGEHTSKLIGDERRYDRKFYTPEQMLQETPEREIPTARVGEKVSERLRDLDKVAYVRFASVYRQFEDVDQFMKVLNDLLEQRK